MEALGLDKAIIAHTLSMHNPSTGYNAITTTVLSFLYKSIISFSLVEKWAYVSWKNKKRGITANLNPVLLLRDSFIAGRDKRTLRGGTL